MNTHNEHKSEKPHESKEHHKENKEHHEVKHHDVKHHETKHHEVKHHDSKETAAGFEGLGIHPEILKAVTYKAPTEVQSKAIPVILSGKDVIAGSATGSGKTFAFGCGIIQICEARKGLQSLVMVPTRELAQQVCDELEKFSRFKQLRVTSVYGGVSINPQIDAVRSAEIVVGTPGRLLDLLDRRRLDLSRIKFLVLDEADRMLDMGFIDDVKEIISFCPAERQTLLFSATISREIADLSRKYMNNPVKIAVNNAVDPKKLKQIYYDIIDDKSKFSLLVHLIKSESSGLIMVFCNTQNTTDFVARGLQKNGIEALAIHGGFTQAKRTQTLEKFQDKKISVLVCTDVAARGLDIGEVSHVYNYDLPNDPKSYVHRIGRTARAGADGIAISLLSNRDHSNFSGILRNIDVKIQRTELPKFERVFVKPGGVEEDDGGDRRGGFRGRGGPRRTGRGESRGGDGESRGRFSGQRRSNGPSRSFRR